MDWINKATEYLRETETWNYRPGGKSYAEPAALTALSLMGQGDISTATLVAEWLAKLQSDEGSVSVSEAEKTPRWPTALALSVWANWEELTGDDRFHQNVKLAQSWSLGHHGETQPRRDGIGHDTSLRGWAWALGTHAWLEPTSMYVMGLHHSGLGTHGATAEAVRLILDRQLPRGGFNYGNTFVLGQQLLSHVQPTGIALSALAVAGVPKSKVRRSIRYLEQQWLQVRSTASLSYAAMGLSAFGQTPEDLEERLELQYKRWKSKRQGTYQLALLTLAEQKTNCLFLSKGLDQYEFNGA